MGRHHIVPRFLIARWASPSDGKIEVHDRIERRVSLKDRRSFYALPGFNTMDAEDGFPDNWLESLFLGGLDNDAARFLKRLEHVQPPRMHLRMVTAAAGHRTHLMSSVVSAASTVAQAGLPA